MKGATAELDVVPPENLTAPDVFESVKMLCSLEGLGIQHVSLYGRIVTNDLIIELETIRCFSRRSALLSGQHS